jgi:hypothetical protein
VTIDFQLTPQQKMLQEGARMVSRDIIRPLSLQMDRDKDAPAELLKRLRDMGASMEVSRGKWEAMSRAAAARRRSVRATGWR